MPTDVHTLLTFRADILCTNYHGFLSLDCLARPFNPREPDSFFPSAKYIRHQDQNKNWGVAAAVRYRLFVNQKFDQMIVVLILRDLATDVLLELQHEIFRRY